MTQEEVLKCTLMIDAHPQSIMNKLATAKDTREAQLFLDDIKKNARKKLRILAKELHPDKTTDVDKHQTLKNLFQIIEELEKTTLDNFISHSQQMIIIEVNFSSSPSTSYWSTDSPTTGGYYR